METNDNLEEELDQQSQKQALIIVPERLICSLSLMIYKEPVFATDGHTYEKTEILNWFQQGQNTSPKTGLPLPSQVLTPNWDKIADVNAFLEQYPELYNEVYLPRSWHAQLVNAIKGNQIDAVNKWLEKDSRLLTIALERDYTALHLAAQFGSLELTNMLLERLKANNKLNAETIIKKPLGFKPVYLSMQKDPEKLSLFLKLIADVKQPEANTTSNTLLYQFPRKNSHDDRDNHNDPNNTDDLTTRLYNVFQNNNDPLCMEPLSEGKMVAGSVDGTITILDEISGLQFQSLAGHTGPITCLRYFANERLLISASADSTIRIWKLQITGEECIRTLHKHTNSVLYLKLLREEPLLASCSTDRTIIIWNLQNWESKILKGHTDAVIHLEQLSDGSLVSCSADNTLMIWNTQTGEHLQTLRGHAGPVTCTVELENNSDNNNYSDNMIASGSTDGTAKLWNIKSGSCLRTFIGHTDSVSCILPWGDRLITGAADTTIRVWDTANGNCTHILRGHSGPVCSLQQLPNGNLMSSSTTKEIKIWGGPDFQEQISPRNSPQKKN